MFTLAISCLTTSSLLWFMDLTFQVPVCYCSYSIRLYFHHQSHPQLGVVFTLALSLHSFWMKATVHVVFQTRILAIDLYLCFLLMLNCLDYFSLVICFKIKKCKAFKLFFFFKVAWYILVALLFNIYFNQPAKLK